MRVVFVAFNINKINAVKYQKYRTKEGAIRAFRQCLEDPEVQFFSIRKVKENV